MSLASAIAEDAALDGLDGTAIGNKIGFVSLHHGAGPGTTGANEMVGSGYARQAGTWRAASGGTKTNSSALTWSTDGVTAVNSFGTFDGATGTNYAIGGNLGSSAIAASITAAPDALSIGAS